jgi:hypothetical protein
LLLKSSCTRWLLCLALSSAISISFPLVGSIGERQERTNRVLRTTSASTCHSCATEQGARIIPNQGVPFPPSAFVTVVVGTVRLRFCRGRGGFSVSVASEFAPQYWEEFPLVADGISQWDTSHPRAFSYSLESFGPILQPRLNLLQRVIVERSL